jgi:cytochrome b subunit of formate dehydrogenase
MPRKPEIKRYGKIVVFEHWLAILVIFTLIFTGLFLVRDWFIHEFHIYGAENYIPTPDFASDFHLYAALGLLIVGLVHLVAHGGQKEKPILPKNSMLELKSALYSLMYLIFLTKKQERGSGDKYLKSQRIIYVYTVYVMGLAAITGFLYYGSFLKEQMLIAHITAGVLVILIGIHRTALIIRKRDRIAVRSVLFKGSMPKWYVKKYHRIWYEKLYGREESVSHKTPKSKEESPEKSQAPPDKEVELKGEEKVSHANSTESV